jgi:PPOX class probable F420-dependent enzyme
MADVLPEAGTPFGDRVRQRLTDSQVIWLTSIGVDGTPQPNPVWFLWDGADSVLVYSRPLALRLKHIVANPRIALNLDGDGKGGDIIVLSGAAALAPDTAASDANAGYLAKYGDAMARVSGSTAEFAADYPIALSVRVDKIRGH